MKGKLKFLVIVAFISAAGFFTSSLHNVKATPSTQIWIPSTDIQKFKTFHLGIDNYIRTQKYNGNRGAGIYDFGLTAGILPFKKLQAEIGVDYISMGDSLYDDYPIYMNLKLGIPEGIMFSHSPAISIGVYNLGIKKNLTNYNIMYGLVAETIPIIGRLSAGYYLGNNKILLDEKGNKASTGFLLSWDRVMSEISDKLWFAIDYQGGKNYLGALNFGLSWTFSDNVSVIFGYDIYNNSKVLYNSKDVNVKSFTTQLDINL